MVIEDFYYLFLVRRDFVNIKDFYKNTKKDIDNATKTFEFKKKEIKKMIANAKKNGNDIGNICNDLLIHINDFECGRIDYIDTDYMVSELMKIQDIVWGKNNE